MDIKKLQTLVVDALEDVKAQDIVVYDTTHLTSLFDRIAIASGTSNRQTKALAASVRDKVKENGGNIVSLEGEDTGEWVLVDLGDMIVHIMQPAIRAYYRLEEIWGDKEVKMGAAKRAKKTAAGDDAAPKKAARHLTVTQQAAAEGEAPKKPARKTAAKSATGAVKTAAKKTVAKKAAKTPAGKTVKVAAPKSASVRKAPAKRARAE
ncbi:ribosome silencing factor [Noviherbaspirillum sp. 1P10PC]|uniref:ribosome silencing factor n=1 Tax=Noviherbaspirillum sp. 1P10PC TaxID=3132292 RepID=UPI0039A34313